MLFYLLFGLIVFGWGLMWLVALGSFLWRQSSESRKVEQKTLVRRSLFGVGLGLLIWLMLFPPLWLVFDSEFGEFPWFKATEIRGTSDAGYDFRRVNIRFKASPQTIQRLANQQGMVRQKGPKEFLAKSMSAPEWGNPKVTRNWWLFDGKNRKNKEFSTMEELTLVYDPQSQVAFYYYDGVD